MTSNTTSNSVNKQQFNTSSSQSETNYIREALGEDDDESFNPELHNDELSSEAGTIRSNGQNLQQIPSTSEAPFSFLSDCEEDTEEIQRRTQKLFKELQFNKPGRQITEFISTELTEYAINRPKRSNKKRSKSRNEEWSKNTNKSVNKLSHNSKGHLVTNRGPIDLCDCLNLECSGCNYPCKKCNSTKCSYACRNGRKTYIESIDELGSTSLKNPFL